MVAQQRLSVMMDVRGGEKSPFLGTVRDKYGGVAVTQTNASIYRFTTCFGLDEPSSGDS
jgi:hypothetical protein